MEIKEQIKTLFLQLSSAEQNNVLKDLPQLSSKASKIEILRKIDYCPHCKSTKIIKHSKYKNTQRYKCKSCNKTFSPTTGTLVHHIKKVDKFSKYAEIVEKEGLLTIAKMASRLGISIPTSFAWRHRILLSLPKKKEKFTKEIQMDDLWFLYSQKGRKGLKYARKRGGSKRKGDNNFQVKVIAASDKQDTEMKVTKIGRISKVDIIQSVGYKFKKGAKLTTDAHKSYVAFAKDAKLEHINFISKKHKAETGENVQYINNLAGRLKTWLNHILRGVSTKYLQLYTSYFAYTLTDNIEISKHINDIRVWDVFTNIEKIYEKFIRTKSVRTYRCPTKKSWKSQNWNGDAVNLYSFL